MLAIPPADACVQMLGSVDQAPCDVQHRGRLGHSFPDFNWIRRAVEPITGIEFPGVLNNILAKENQSNLSPEYLQVLVGTGSRTVTIIKIKSFKLYAFGFYVHPYSVCQKLGSKYASMPASELKDHNEFYADLLREDIGMTVRLVVNCNGMKINAVKDTFEKSLRARLVKTNPETDFKCIETFGSFFTKDIPLPVGTIIDLRRTADGQLITEIGGSQIGAVHSRELCRAFFDMYLGEVPVSKETKEEIGSNVASIVGRC
ncbi:fatty-acid-binding protein 2 isoform X2 [Silene latifolia]|uniref:fatty-acid-binding protein 2 isoform X2 n=1 Tax=Silene latifolia TaxID=37657 RepID=UPI003D774815